MWRWGSKFTRFLTILYVIFQFRLYEYILPRSSWLRSTLFFVNPWAWRASSTPHDGLRLCLALEALGPIFVKAGQLLATRYDLIPPEIALALTKLQDRAEPFSSKKAKKMIVRALGQPLAAIFQEFDDVPLAAASIAQVHSARLHTGEAVIVKVLRPHIHRIIALDIDLMYTIARWMVRLSPNIRQFKPILLVEEIAYTLEDEIDLMKEAANASLLRRNFEHDRKLYVPAMHWPYCRNEVLVSERIYGIPLHDFSALKAAQIDFYSIAQLCIDVFFTQVFRDNYFHADLHPGNLFISKNEIDGTLCLIAVDFGIMGSLNSQDQRYIAENMMAFFERDYQRVGELHVASGWLPPDTRLDRFESAIRAVSEPIFGRPLQDISFGHLLLNLFQVARRFQINIQPQLVLLQKTLLTVESLARQLAPQLDLWRCARPYVERWLKQQVGVRGLMHRVRKNAPIWSEILPEIPALVYEVLHEKRQQQERERFQRLTAHATWTWLSYREKIGWMVLGAVICGAMGWGYSRW